MRELGKKKMVVVALLAIVLVCMVVKVSAVDGPIQINTTPDTNTATTNTASNATTNTTTNTASPIAPTTNTASNRITNTASSNYTNTSNLPQTGDASDYVIFAVIGVAIISAIYAFKKVRDYNI